MSSLSQASCEACSKGSTALSGTEQRTLLEQLPDWHVVIDDNVEQLQRTYNFKDFKSALAFTNAVGALAEAENHHPALLTEWGKVTVSWWTHAINGLHRNDFILAARSDEAANGKEKA